MDDLSPVRSLLSRIGPVRTLSALVDNMKYVFPVATILKSEKVLDGVRTTLELNELLTSPLAPASLSTRHSNSFVLELHKVVQRKDTTFTLETYDVTAALLRPGEKYNFTTWWRPDQLQLAQDTTRVWHKRTYIAQSAGDHEHCFLCWRRISNNASEDNSGYTDGRDWLCETCHNRYIESGFGARLGE